MPIIRCYYPIMNALVFAERVTSCAREGTKALTRGRIWGPFGDWPIGERRLYAPRYRVRRWDRALCAFAGAIVLVAGNAALAQSPTGVPMAAVTIPDLTPFVGSVQENRADLAGTGNYDSYWRTAADAGVHTCSLWLYNIANRRLRWTAKIPNCLQIEKVVFHTKSFMGDGTRDFTLVIKAQPGFPHDLGYALVAGDGATGLMRDWRFRLGNAQRPEILRTNAVSVVDFKLPKYPGPALIARNNGGGFDQHAHLFYFPKDSNSGIDLTEDPLSSMTSVSR